MSAFGTRLASAHADFTLDDSRFQRAGTRVIRSMGKMSQHIDRVASSARRMLVVGGVALGFFVKQAADAEESASRFRAVLREAADEAGEAADDIANRIGRSTIDVRDSIAVFASFFKGLGRSSREAGRLGTEISELALDFASFNNISDDEALSRFISALSGSGEVLDRFGVNIKEAALKAQLALSGVTGEATEMQKTMARMEIIRRAMGDQGALGDATRTAGSLTNQLKALKGEAKDVAVSIGTSFVPAISKQIARLREAAPAIKDWVTQNQGAIVVNTILAAKVLALVAVLPLATRLVRLLIAAFVLGPVAGFSAVLAGIIAIPLVKWLSEVANETSKLQREMDELTAATQETAKAYRELREAQESGDPQRIDAAAKNVEAKQQEDIELHRKRIRELNAQITKAQQFLRQNTTDGETPKLFRRGMSGDRITSRLDTIAAAESEIESRRLTIRKLEAQLQERRDASARLAAAAAEAEKRTADEAERKTQATKEFLKQLEKVAKEEQRLARDEKIRAMLAEAERQAAEEKEREREQRRAARDQQGAFTAPDITPRRGGSVGIPDAFRLIQSAASGQRDPMRELLDFLRRQFNMPIGDLPGNLSNAITDDLDRNFGYARFA